MEKEEDSSEITKAKLELTLQQAVLHTLRAEHAHFLRWEIATLLAINAGAIVAILNQPNFIQANAKGALALFALGIVCAVLLSVFAQKSLSKQAHLTEKHINLHIDTISNRHQAILDGHQHEKDINSAKKLLLSYYPFSIGSLASFIIGCIILLCSFEEHKNSQPPLQSSTSELTIRNAPQ